MIFKKPNLLYAVDENSLATRLFNYDPVAGNLSNEIASFNGSSGVVHLAFNADQTKLIGSSYAQGTVDVWDASPPDGHPTYYKKIILQGYSDPRSTNQQGVHRAHQAVLDPSGRFFLINDLGGDALHIIDTGANYSVVNIVPVTSIGSGPRHGAFISVSGTEQASHYVVACELTSTLQLFSVSYDNNTLSLTGIHTIPSYDPVIGLKNTTTAAAGELIVSQSGPTHIYVTNRHTGNDQDSVARFALEAKSTTDKTAQLVFKGQVDSSGIGPRSIAFSNDPKQETLFVANQYGLFGLLALHRIEDTGQMKGTPSVFGNMQFTGQAVDPTGHGPQFILTF